MANFGRGAKGAKEEAKRLRPAFERTNFLRLKDGESKVIRFIDDYNEWPYVGQHGNIPTKPAPADFDSKDSKWPPHMGAVCRKSKNEGEPVFPDLFESGCFICDHMTGNKKTKNGRYYPSIKLWARAVVRDEVLGTKAMLEAGDIEDWEVGQPVGFQDHLIDHEETDKEGKPTGKTVKRPEIVVINQSQQNFFGAVEANALSYGSACDRDYKVTREGSELDTTYSIVAMDPIIEELESGKRRKWSLANAAVKAEYLKHAPDLEEVITDQASDEYFARFFDTRVEAPKRGKAKEKATEVDEDGVGSGAAETEDTEDVATDVADMRARLESRVGKKPVAATTGADED